MTDNHAQAARLKDQHDQPDLVERIAGQAARDMPDPPQLAANTLAQIAVRINAQTSKPRGTLRFSRMLVAASVLFGIVTVASAARLALVPRWIAKMVGMEEKPIRMEPLPRKGESWPAAKKTEPPQPGVPTAAPANTGVPPEGAAPAQAAEPTATHAVSELAAAPARPVRRAQSDSKSASTDGRLAPRKTQSLAMLDSKPAIPLPGAPPTPSMVLPSPPPPTPIAAPASIASAPTPSERPALAIPATPTPKPLPRLQAQPTLLLPTPPAAMNPAARHLKDVVRALRVDHAPRTALDLLDRHASELAGNAFAEESLLLRVEALLALKQQSAALRLLDATPMAASAASSVLLVTRGQLRASADRCLEAMSDFDLALARRPSKGALLGRAHCKQKLGDSLGAQADRDRYRREFPNQPVR